MLDVPTGTIRGTGISHSEECRRRIEETKRKRRDFIERDAKKLKVNEGAEEEQNDEQMDTVGSGGSKRKAEDNQETEAMEVMDRMCENANDLNTLEEDDMLEEYKVGDCMGCDGGRTRRTEDLQRQLDVQGPEAREGD